MNASVANPSPPRVEPVPPPFSPELQAVFERIMPPGVPPLRLFFANGLRLAPEPCASPLPPGR